MAKATTAPKKPKKPNAKIKKLNVEDLNTAIRGGMMMDLAADSSEIACKQDPKLTGC